MTRPKPSAKSRKRQLGEYYTPDWVVDYIVRHTVGPTLRDHPERLLGEFTILDPACGDGAFLLGALQFLVSCAPAADEDERRLTLRSIVDCLHGVDVNAEAVSRCRERLANAAAKYLGSGINFNQRIVLGNSLIQEDAAAAAVFGEKLAQMHPVVWPRIFPWVMRDAGFDIIVGNPPFVGVKALDAQEKEYFRRRFHTAHQQFDILVAFIELGLELLRPGGRLGFVVSNKVLAADYGLPLRKLLVSSFIIEQMLDLSQLNVFEDAATYPQILILRKPYDPEEVRRNEIVIPARPTAPKDLETGLSKAIRVPQRFYAALPGNIMTPVLSPARFEVLQRLLRNTTPLGRMCGIRCGIAKTGFNKLVLTQAKYRALSKRRQQDTLNFLATNGVRRYQVQRQNYLTYSPAVSSREQWKDFEEPKLVIAGMGKHLRAALDTGRSALGRVYYITKTRCPFDLFYLLALLNSDVVDAYYSLLFAATHLRGDYIRYNASYLEQIPVPSTSAEQQEALADLANLASQNPANLRKGLDPEINDLVAKAYGLKPKDVEVLRVT
jgi:hypothetical protein